MLKKTLAATLMAATLAVGAGGAGAVGHPDHLQRDRGNGPADVDNGNGRSNPAGSNGTIKIDGFNWDGHPNNEPHIGGCTFQVDFYGFDEGDTAQLTFLQWPGTGNKSEIGYTWGIAGDGGVDMPLPGGDVIPFDDDGAGGGVDIDQQVEITLFGDLGNEHKKHGYHIRAEAEITSTHGTYTKVKVFWVSGDCDDEPPSGGFDWPLVDLPT